MKVLTLRNLLNGQPHDIFVAETDEEQEELDGMVAEGARPSPPPPGPDGLPYIRRVPKRPRIDGDMPWHVELRVHPSQPVWQPLLAHASGAFVTPPVVAPVFYTFEEAALACDRAAARLGVLFRDSM